MKQVTKRQASLSFCLISLESEVEQCKDWEGGGQAIHSIQHTTVAWNDIAAVFENDPRSFSVDSYFSCLISIRTEAHSQAKDLNPDGRSNCGLLFPGKTGHKSVFDREEHQRGGGP